MAAYGLIEKACQSLFEESAETAVPRLMRERKAPHRVAAVLDVAPTAVRKWITNRGWYFDGDKWVEPVAEQPHV